MIGLTTNFCQIFSGPDFFYRDANDIKQYWDELQIQWVRVISNLQEGNNS